MLSRTVRVDLFIRAVVVAGLFCLLLAPLQVTAQDETRPEDAVTTSTTETMPSTSTPAPEIIPLLPTLQAMQTAQAALSTIVLETPPTDQPLTLLPETLTIDATRPTTETRLVLVRASRTITNLQAIILDLPRPDNHRVLGHQQIALHQSLPPTLTAGSLITIPITLDLTSIESGEYTGKIHFIYANGETFLPLTIRVKDSAAWPLIVLTLAVVIGLTVTQYRSGAFRLDEVGARLDRLNHEIRERSMREGLELLKENRALAAQVATAQQQLDNHKPDEAEQAIQAAYRLLADYNQDSSARYENEKQKLDLLLHGEPKEPYVKSVTGIPDSAHQDPAQRIMLERATQAISDYIAVEESIAKARQIAQTQPEVQALVKDMEREQASLKQIDPLRQPDEARHTIENIAATRQKLEQHAHRQRGNARPGNAAQARLQSPVAATETATYTAYLTSLLQSEVTAPTPDSKSSQASRWRMFWAKINEDLATWLEELRWKLLGPHMRLVTFKVIVTATVLILLSLTGFVQLYTNNPTFGSNAVVDYLALVVWGLGAEAARSAIGVVGSWNTPVRQR
ncbi:phage tail tape measure protein [Candidatus Chloroploca sp. M-50]|uniref:Phage tail tape measure protein n=1 Tax=Candidatus Chloroploca mongolica TaxID=2528176 RepID=A0ABS4DD44_9CHLR|nr:phage tail tape measure protein [Candidatus Chloroploca mongolica]MBP1467366.1 phage tail tape measure protein [Candidatus Chloroploca mongolica]